MKKKLPTPPTTNIPCREKYWSELLPDQRIERLRNEVRRQADVIEDLKSTINKLLGEFQLHQHGITGTVLVESTIKYDNQQWFEKRARSHTSNPDDVYL